MRQGAKHLIPQHAAAWARRARRHPQAQRKEVQAWRMAKRNEQPCRESGRGLKRSTAWRESLDSI